uniref:Uncharacterized protein n=1 Tax=Rhizophora mucronata TaxID=61149 RepID=A0A2P2JE86_RHIMU
MSYQGQSLSVPYLSSRQNVFSSHPNFHSWNMR